MAARKSSPARPRRRVAKVHPSRIEQSPPSTTGTRRTRAAARPHRRAQWSSPGGSGVEQAALRIAPPIVGGRPDQPRAARAECCARPASSRAPAIPSTPLGRSPRTDGASTIAKSAMISLRNAVRRWRVSILEPAGRTSYSLVCHCRPAMDDMRRGPPTKSWKRTGSSGIRRARARARRSPRTGATVDRVRAPSLDVVP